VAVRAAPDPLAFRPLAGTLLGRASGRLPRRGTRVIRVRLSRRGRVLLRRFGELRVRVDAEVVRGRRARFSFSYGFTTVLRRP
jgi:hypothetical protein